MLHINVLELLVVWLMLASLKKTLFSQMIQVESDNLTTVAYINKEGGVHSQALNCKTMLLYEWSILLGTQLQVVYRSGQHLCGLPV